MPMRATDKLEIYIFQPGAMVFYVVDEDRNRVRCSISEGALRQLDPPIVSWGKQTSVGCLRRTDI